MTEQKSAHTTSSDAVPKQTMAPEKSPVTAIRDVFDDPFPAKADVKSTATNRAKSVPNDQSTSPTEDIRTLFEGGGSKKPQGPTTTTTSQVQRQGWSAEAVWKGLREIVVSSFKWAMTLRLVILINALWDRMICA